MRDANLMLNVWSYGGEGAKPEPAKPKPADTTTEKPAEKTDGNDTSTPEKH